MIGQTYMLGEDEELWEKSVPAIVKYDIIHFIFTQKNQILIIV